MSLVEILRRGETFTLELYRAAPGRETAAIHFDLTHVPGVEGA